MTNKTNQHSWWALIVVILTVTLSAQMLRTLFPLVIFKPGATPDFMARHLIVVYLLPFLIPFVSRWIGPRRLLLISVGGLAVLRLGMQLSASTDLSLLLTSAGVVLAFTAQMLLLSGVLKIDYHRLAMGFIGGLTLDALLNTAFLTWDYVWQRTPVALAVALLVSGVLLIALWYEREKIGDPDPNSLGRTPWIVLLGPFWVLELGLLNNTGWAAAQFTAGFSGVIAVLGDLLGLFFASTLARLRFPIIRLAIAMMLIGLLWTVGVDNTRAWIFILPIIQLLTCVLFYQLLSPTTNTTANRGSLVAFTFGLGCVLFVGLVVLYYVGYQFKVPTWTSAAVEVGTGFLFALSVFRHQYLTIATRIYWLHAIPSLFLVIIVASLVIIPYDIGNLAPYREYSTSSTEQPQLRIMTYNIHQGASTDGWIDLEALAETIEAQNPDVVLLQEVVRGQLITGSTDTVDWLATRLHMNYYFSPAVDRTFGNALLTHFEIMMGAGRDYWINGIQTRSYVQGFLSTGTPGLVRVIGTHLDLDPTVRFEQAEELSESWMPNTIAGDIKLIRASLHMNIMPTLVAGDMNAVPNSPEMNVLLSSGLTSAQDATGNGALFTFPSTGPRSRIDWIFGSPDVWFSDFTIPQSTASDHLPIAVTVHLKDKP